MRAALVTEYRKLVTTRLWWILLLCMAVYMASCPPSSAGASPRAAAMGSTGEAGGPTLAWRRMPWCGPSTRSP